MSKNPYSPSSHFFVDHNYLYSADDPNNPGNEAADGFGPVSGNATNQYRTTSIIRTSTTSKVFAICDGHVLIQPYEGDSTKVNLVLKPTSSYAPFKIKYFIYRGVNKDELIFGFDLVHSTPDAPEFIKRVWKASNDLAEALNQSLPLNLDGKLIGYNPSQSDDELLSYVYFGIETEDEYNIPKCFKGEFIGNFTDKIGLDIVLDYGDYELDYEEQLFKLDLEYARKPEHVFDISTITGAVKQKRFREYIHQFIDAAAFWGSHIDGGGITIFNDTNLKTTVDEIYPLVNKYQTANQLYVYIQSERGRSFNFYGNNGQISFDIQGTSPRILVDYEYESWPILVKKITPGAINISELQFSFNYNIDSLINAQVVNLACYCRFPNWNSENLINTSQLLESTSNPDPKPETPIRLSQSKLIEKIPVRMKNLSSVFHPISNFYFINTMGNQTMESFEVYYDLWKVNLLSIFNINNQSNEDIIWSNFNKYSVKNFSQIGINHSVNSTKLITDFGENSSGSTEERNLFVSGISDISEKYTSLIPKGIESAFQKNLTSENYGLILYNDPNYRVYKASLDDGSIISGLNLINELNHSKNKSFIQIGILKKERNKLLYDSEIIPDITSPTYVPFILNPANIFLYLEEDNTILPSKGFRKFKLGVRYEDDTGVINTKFPTTDIFIYTFDNLFYCSQRYAEYQKFYEEFPKSKVDFRLRSTFTGEFGFDWMRIGDTGQPGDVDYKNYMGKLYIDAAHTSVVTDINQYSGYFNVIPPMYKRLELDFNPYPTQSDLSNNIIKYYVPKLSIYPLYVPPIPPIPDLDRQAIFTPPYDDTVNRIASLKLNINIVIEPVRLEFEYDSSIFVISPLIIPKTIGTHTLDLTVRAIRDFGIEKEISVKAFYNDTSGMIDIVGKKVGILKIRANSKTSRGSKKVVLVTIKTNINGTDKFPFANDKALFLKKFLRQMNITPVIELVELDLRANSFFNNNYVHFDGSTHVVISRNDSIPALDKIQNFLKNQNVPGTTSSIDNTYPSSFRLFFFEENGGYINSAGTYVGLNGSSLGKDILGFVTANDATATHEFSHSAKLPHSFTAYEASKYADFTYEPKKTDNILDYSHQVGINRVLFWVWQAKIAFSNSDVEP